ncbi:phage capsid protein [candidate division KSB1 bacterium]|nr:phage capsid protein [candidate division KSB1 bacterium]
MPGNFPFPIQPQLTAIAIAYKNGAYIADSVLPRTPVGLKAYRYRKYSLGDSFSIPDTSVGRTSRPNQVEFGFTEETGYCMDHALDDPVPQDDIDNAPANYNPLGVSTEFTSNLIELDREARVARLVQDAANYPATNKAALSGTSVFTDPASDPIATIMSAMDSMIVRPNAMVVGRQAWSALIRNAAINKAVNRNVGDKGVARKRDLADLFELSYIFVGESWLNCAKKGQSPTIARVWGPHIVLIYRDVLSGPARGTTFGFTAQFGTRMAGAEAEKNIGMRGGQMVRVGESVDEKICAAEMGYLIQNCA